MTGAMRFPLFPLLAAAFVDCVTLAGTAIAAAPMPAWLSGTWAMESGAAWADEVWTSDRGGMMLGLERSGFGPEVESWHTARIERRPTGLVYVIQAKGGEPVEYQLVLAGDGAVEFANQGTTWPQRIRWWREGQLLMREMSRIDGTQAERANFRPRETAPAD